MQPRAEAKPETQNAPLRPRDQRTRDRLTFTQRGPRPGNASGHFLHNVLSLSLNISVNLCLTSAILSLLDGVQSSESQAGKSHLNFVNKGNYFSRT